jgi:hypothetical protein
MFAVVVVAVVVAAVVAAVGVAEDEDSFLKGAWPHLYEDERIKSKNELINDNSRELMIFVCYIT